MEKKEEISASVSNTCKNLFSSLCDAHRININVSVLGVGVVRELSLSEKMEFCFIK